MGKQPHTKPRIENDDYTRSTEWIKYNDRPNRDRYGLSLFHWTEERHHGQEAHTPLGFIHRTTDDEAIIMLTKTSHSQTLRSDTPATLRSRSVGGPPATARVCGLMTSVGYVTATFRVVETRIDSKWPDGEQALRPAHAVYQVLHASFDLDPGRALSDEQAEGLRCLAARYRNITNANPPKGGGPPKPSGNGTPTDRSVRSAVESFRKQGGKTSERNWENWASRYDWRNRAAEHDSDLASRRRERMAQELDRAQDDASVLIRAALRTLIELELKVLGYEDRVAVTGKDGGPVKTEHIFQPPKELWDEILLERAKFEALRDGDTDEETSSDSL